MPNRSGMNKYPRYGERIAPTTLHSVLLEPLPERLQAAFGPVPLRLCDLTERLWGQVPEATILELAEIIVVRVRAACAQGVFDDVPFPDPPRETDLGDLRLEHRTQHCLSRAGFERDFQSLGNHTIGEILRLHAFGARCLVDLLSAVETHLARHSAADCRLVEAAERLAALGQAARIGADDPRFGKPIRALDVEATTAAEMANRLLERQDVPGDPAFAADQIETLCEDLEAAVNLTVEQELTRIFAADTPGRNREILVGYYGWGDGKRHTLAAVGDRFGITRERTRQICAKMTRRHERPETIYAPVIERALAAIRRRAPCSSSQLEAELVQEGFTAVGMEVESLIDGAKLLKRRAGFTLEGVSLGRRHQIELVVPEGEADLVAAAIETARREIYYHGIATLEHVCRQVAKRLPGRGKQRTVVKAVEALPGFVRLDRKDGWFRVASIAKHGLPKTIEKVLAVAGEISVGALREAMSRNRRLWREPPPEHVLLEFCRQMPDMHVEGKRIRGNPPKDWKKVLTGIEARLVATLMRDGPIMDRGRLEDVCVSGGMNRFSFHAFLAWSPVIAQFGHSVYGLLGARPDDQQLHSLSERRRTERYAHRVLEGHGRTADGRIWLKYRLSKAASTYAVITIPAALKETVRGRFELLDSTGESIGALATKDGRAWGLGAFLRKQNAQIGDAILVTIDVNRKTATARLCPPDAPLPGS